MPPEIDSTLDKGNKGKGEGKNLYSMIEKIKTNRFQLYEAKRETSMLPPGLWLWGAGLKPCVCVWGGGQVQMGQSIKSCFKSFRRHSLYSACLSSGLLYPEWKLKWLVSRSMLSSIPYDLGGDTKALCPNVFSFLCEIPTLWGTVLSSERHILQSPTELELCARQGAKRSSQQS